MEEKKEQAVVVKPLTLAGRLQKAKKELVDLKLVKTGKNTYSGFEYFELSDFLPSIVRLCEANGVFTYVTFDDVFGTLTAVNVDDKEDKIIVQSPMREIQMKGANAIQQLGAVETYTRRYLYLALFDITEPDILDKELGNPKSDEKQQAKPRQQTPKPQAPKPQKIDLRTIKGEPLHEATLVEIYTLPQVYQDALLKKCGVTELGQVNQAQAEYVLNQIKKAEENK